MQQEVMMGNVVMFTPRPELEASENLAAFITFAKEKLIAFGKNLSFDDVVWDVTDECKRKANNKRERITFCTLDSAGKTPIIPLHDAFKGFAQSYIRYMQVMRPVVGLGFRMAALRALEKALSESGALPSPVKTDSIVLNRAAQLIKEKFNDSAAYRISMQLEMIAQYLKDHALTAVQFQWRNPIKRPHSSPRVGKAFDERRTKMMPSERALNALPQLFHMATKPKEILITSIAAILCSAPDRISEVLQLPVDCEVQQKEAYGLRWWPAKGADPMIKWILPSMVSVVKEAIARIKKVTEEAREIAQWYESNPGKLFLRPENEYLRKQPLLSMEELGSVLWGDKAVKGSAALWCTSQHIQKEKINNKVYVRFKEVEKAVWDLMPAHFPKVDINSELNLRKALTVIPKNLFHDNKATYVCAIETIQIQHINDGLGARSEHGAPFDTFHFTEDDGSPIKVTTHQFRHYLNTLAQAGGLSQLDIAKWSGRKDISQNEAYNHVTADEMLVNIRNAIGDTETIGPLAEIPKHFIIKRDEFACLMIPTAHTTEIGFCIHDYTMTPCQEQRDCINCQEHVCIKGDRFKTEQLKQKLIESVLLLDKAKQAVSEGYYGAERWLEHHQQTTERLEQLCDIMNDKTIPDGAVIQLNNVESASRIEQAVTNRRLSIEQEENRSLLRSLTMEGDLPNAI